MIKIVLNGCNGKMGKWVSECAAAKNDLMIVAGVDISGEQNASYPVYTKFSDFDGEADVIIDFSHPSALEPMLEYAQRTGTPAVIATTGLSDGQIQKINSASKDVALFFSANMSIGVNLLAELAKAAAKALYADFDIEIIEKHHNQKIDAPSGTALMLADEISSALPETVNYEYDRHSKRKKRDHTEIGIHTVRGGTIVGEHEIIFAGEDEIITISHSARSKKLFAIGCLNAAEYIYNKAPGMYSMSDLVADK